MEKLKHCHPSMVLIMMTNIISKRLLLQTGDYCSIISGCYKSPPLPEISSRDLKVVEGVILVSGGDTVLGFAF